MSRKLAVVLSAIVLIGLFACTDTEGGGGSGGAAGAMAGAAGEAGANGMAGANATGGSSGSDSGTAGEAGMMAEPMLGPDDVMTDKGIVQGKVGGTVRTFLGIPYAAAPVGENRWKAPQPVQAWTDTKLTVRATPICAQLSPSTRAFAGEEDCLSVNVFTPVEAPAAPLPVMVWIHGGAFVFGSGSDLAYAGDHLVDRGDIVMVTLNYRLGALGYLAHDALSAADASMTSGNYGLMDQQAALQWVKSNIAAFGGDPANVTIFGESAGGHSVCWHLVSPQSEGLFAKAIVESGYCTKPTYPRAGAEAQGARFATALGCTDAAQALACMRGKTPEELVMATQSMGGTPGGIFYQDRMAGFAFEPTIDGLTITDQPAALLAGATVKQVPVLQGANTDEGILFHEAVLGTVMPVADEAEYLAALTVRYGADDAAEILAQYPVADYASANEALTAVTADSVFVCAARKTARLLAARAMGATYLYSFSGLLTGVPIPALAGKAFHSGELPFVFGNTYALGSLGPDVQATADAMQDYWLQFARSGDPNTTTAPAQWPAYTETTDTLLSIGTTIEPTPMYQQAACDFWDTITPPELP